MSKVKVGRPVNDVSINGDEFLLDDSNQVMLFDNEVEAFIFLKEQGFTKEQIDSLNFIKV